MMKLIFAISLLGFTYKANATNYYVSNAGSNSNNGTSIGTPFQTIAKVVSVAASGDSIFLNKGDSWNEQMIVPASNIYVGSYGTGNKPVITGFQTLSGFVNTSGNIWSATATNAVNTFPVNGINTHSGLNTVLIGGGIKPKGRWPNSTYNKCYPNTSTYIISETHLTQDYTGGEVVVRSSNFTTDVCRITSTHGDTINFTPALTYAPTGELTYFIQNLPSLIDTQNEWCINDTTKLLSIYSVGAPSTVQYSTLDTLVKCINKSDVTFNGISFTGGNTAAVEFDSSNYFTCINSAISNSGFNGLQGFPSNYTLIKNDSIQNSLNNGMRIFGDSIKIRDTYVYSVGMYEGMGGSGNGQYIGFYGGYPNRDSLSITGNTFRNVGFNAIYFQGTKSLIKNNIIDSFCIKKDDGGGIYCYDNNTSGSLLRGNIITNGIGVLYLAAGIYFDYHTAGVTADSNTIFNTRLSGLHAGANSLGANYLYDNIISTVRSSSFALIEAYANCTNVYKRNITYSMDSTVLVVNANVPNNTLDSNYYMYSFKSAALFKNTNNNITYSFSNWQSAGYDTHSSLIPILANSSTGTLYINATSSDSTVTFTGKKVDAKGNTYSGSITIHPYQSALLFPAFSDNVNIIGGIKIL